MIIEDLRRRELDGDLERSALVRWAIRPRIKWATRFGETISQSTASADGGRA